MSIASVYTSDTFKDVVISPLLGPSISTAWDLFHLAALTSSWRSSVSLHSTSVRLHYLRRCLDPSALQPREPILGNQPYHIRSKASPSIGTHHRTPRNGQRDIFRE